MSTIDWLIIAFALLLMPIGYRQGMLVGVLTLGGFALGALAGSRLGPVLLAEGPESPYAPAMALVGGLVIGGLLAVLLEGAGVALRDRLLAGTARRRLDAAGGAVVLALLALSIAWVIGAVALNAPALERYRDEIQRSTILAALNDVMPPSGPVLNVLNEIAPTPALSGPSADVAAPKGKILGDPDIERAGSSVVRVLGTACGLSISGSGWVAADGLVVTNAHVIAGEEDTRIETRDGTSFEATAVAYRPRDDIAVLRVPGLALAPLPLAADPAPGTPGAIAGFPGSGGFTLEASRLGTTGEVRSENSYGEGPVDREMTSFRGKVQSGNSGGPVIDADGRVMATVFASTLGRDRPEGLGVPNSIVRKVLSRAEGETGTGPCAR